MVLGIPHFRKPPHWLGTWERWMGWWMGPPSEKRFILIFGITTSLVQPEKLPNLGFLWFLMGCCCCCCCCCFSDSMFAFVLPVFSPLFLLALFFPMDLVIPWAWQVYGRVLGKILSESQGQGRDDLVWREIYRKIMENIGNPLGMKNNESHLLFFVGKTIELNGDFSGKPCLITLKGSSKWQMTVLFGGQGTPNSLTLFDGKSEPKQVDQFEEQLGARENLVGFLRISYIDYWNWRLWGQWQACPRIIYLWNIDRIRRLPKTWSFRCFRELQASLDNTSHRAHPLFLGACSTTVWNGGNLQCSTWLKVAHHRIMGRTYIFDLPKNERV